MTDAEKDIEQRIKRLESDFARLFTAVEKLTEIVAVMNKVAVYHE